MLMFAKVSSGVRKPSSECMVGLQAVECCLLFALFGNGFIHLLLRLQQVQPLVVVVNSHLETFCTDLLSITALDNICFLVCFPPFIIFILAMVVKQLATVPSHRGARVTHLH